MPIYEYKCRKCGEEFEELVMGSHPEVACPKCGGECDKLMSAACFRSKGGDGGDFTAPSGGGGCAGCTSTNCASCHG